MEKMELIKPGIYKKTVRGQKFNNAIKNKFQNLQERIENLKKIKPSGKMLKEKTLQPKLRQSMLLRAFKSSEKNLISSTPYHKNKQQFFENISSVPISPINVNGSPNSSSSEVISTSHKSKNEEKECLPLQDSSLIFVGQESPEKESASLIKRRSRRDMTPNRNKKSIQESHLQHTPSPKQMSTCHRSRIQKSPTNQLHNSPQHSQFKCNKLSKIPVRKKSQDASNTLNFTIPNLVVRTDLTRMSRSVSFSSAVTNDKEQLLEPVTVQNSHRHGSVHSEDVDAGLLENIHKNCTLEQLKPSDHQSINTSKSAADNMRDKSAVVEVADVAENESADEERTIYVNKTPTRKCESIYKSYTDGDLENERNDADQRRALEDFVRSVGLSPVIPTTEIPQTPQRQNSQQTSMSLRVNKSVADKREVLHKTLERIRQQSTRATQVTPVKSLTKNTTKSRKHPRLSKTNAFDRITQTSMGEQVPATSPMSIISESSSVGTAAKLVRNAYNDSQCPNIFDSLLEGNDLQLNFSDTEYLHFSSSATAKPWRINSEEVSGDYDSIKLNFIRSENQIRSLQLGDSLSDSDSEDATLTIHSSPKNIASNIRTTIMQTGKRQYNKKKRKSRHIENQSRKSIFTRKSNRRSLKRNIRELTPNSIESGLDTDTAGVTTNKQLFSVATRSGSGNLSNTSSDIKLLGLAEEPKGTENDKVVIQEDKDSSKKNINTCSEEFKTKELLIILQNTNKIQNTINHEVGHHSPLSPEISRHSRYSRNENQQKSLETGECESIAPNIESGDGGVSEVIDILTKTNESAISKSVKEHSKKMDNKRTRSEKKQSSMGSTRSTRSSKVSTVNTSLNKELAQLHNISKKKKQTTSAPKRLSLSNSDKTVVSETVTEVTPKHSTENLHQSIVQTTDTTLTSKQRRGRSKKQEEEMLEPPSNLTANTKGRTIRCSLSFVTCSAGNLSTKKLEKTARKIKTTQQTSHININEGRPKRERKPVRFHTDIVVTDAMKIKPRIPKYNKRNPSLKNKSKRVDETNLGKGKNDDQTGQVNMSILQEEALETVALPVEQDPTVVRKVDGNKKKSVTRPSRKTRFNKGSSGVPAIDNKHLESTAVSNSRHDHDQIEKELPKDMNNPKRQSTINSWRNSTESVAQGNLMSTNDTDLMTSEIMPPPRTTLDSGFVTMKKNGLIENNSRISGVKNGYVNKSDKKNKAKSVSDRISRAMENLPHSILQYDTTVNSQPSTISHSRRLTGAELINDDYINYMSNNTLYSIKYLNRVPLDSEFKTYQNLHLRESMKDPSGSCSSGYIKLNPGDRKRPSIATKYSFFYNIISGSASIQLHNKTNMVYQGDFFFVPLGIEYSIRNIDKDSPLILYYVKVRGDLKTN